MSMTRSANRRKCILALVAALLIAGAAPAFAASTEADFKAAFAAAEAADKGNFEQATALSRDAEALAKASIFQAASEKEGWKNLEIR